jgi:HK97 family phage major capsid protein
MWSRMYADSRTNAIWLINQSIEPELYGMGITVGVGGSPVYLPPGGASAQPYGTLFGRPVIPCNYCSKLGDVGDIILADFAEYILIEKGGVQEAISMHYGFITDQTYYRFVMRIDGQPAWSTYFTPEQATTATQSPFVTLEAR